MSAPTTSKQVNDITAAIQIPEPPPNPQNEDAITYLLAFSEASVKSSVLQAASNKKPSGRSPKVRNPEPIADEELKIRARRHATCLLLAYYHGETTVFVSGLRALVLHQGGSSLFSSLVLQNCSGLIELFPRPLASVLLDTSDEDQQNPITSETLPINNTCNSRGPALDGVPTNRLHAHRNRIKTVGSPVNYDNNDMADYSRKDLEQSWDSLLKLYRQYLGEIANVSAGVLDNDAAAAIVRGLHPSTVTRLAGMFVQLISQSAHKRNNTRSFSSAKGRAPIEKGRGGRGRAVASKIHPVPNSVRNLFAPELSQLFWLDFLHTVDSSKLNGALAAALARELVRVLGETAHAVDNEELSKVVAEARMLGKVLCIVVGGCNWGVAIGDKENIVRRSEAMSAGWCAVMDVEKVIRNCVESGCVKTVVAAVAVADVMVRLSVQNPFVKRGDWYKRMVNAIKSVRVVADGNENENMELPMPLVQVLVGDALLEATSSCSRLIDEDTTSNSHKFVLKVKCDTWKNLGDNRLLELLCPSLLAVRNLALDVKRSNSGTKQIHGKGHKAAPLVMKKHATHGRVVKNQLEKEVGKTYRPPGEQKAQDLKQKENDQLWQEFQRRVDVRLLHAMNLVTYSDVRDPESARSAYMMIVNKLYPCKSQTVCQVIAQKCAEIVQSKVSNSGDVTSCVGSGEQH